MFNKLFKLKKPLEYLLDETLHLIKTGQYDKIKSMGIQNAFDKGLYKININHQTAQKTIRVNWSGTTEERQQTVEVLHVYANNRIINTRFDKDIPLDNKEVV